MLLKNIVAAATAIGLASAQSNLTLSQALNSSSQLSALSSLLNQVPNFDTLLSNFTNITLLAPNNEALNALISAPGSQALLSDQAAVESLLLYHVLRRPIYASNITSTPSFAATFLNNSMYTNVTGGQVVEVVREAGNVSVYSGYKNLARVTQANLNFTGGTIHVIDSVLTIPGSVVDTAVVAGLTDLVGAVVRANLTSALSGLNTTTVFAPTNGAFSAIGSALGSLSQTQLASILEYHVINGTAAYSSTLTNGSVPTLLGRNATITIEDGAVFVNQARVIVADILVANGVCHVIDAVLNPNNTNATAGATSASNAFPGATSGTADLTSGVPTASTTAGPALTSTESNVASGYTTMPSSIGQNPAGNPTTSSGMAALPTAAIGAAALFGAGAFMANF